MSAPVVTLTIDGSAVEARAGETVLQAARRAGIDIPHFCYHDRLSIAGNCRMCLVKVSNSRKLEVACMIQPTENLARLQVDVR